MLHRETTSSPDLPPASDETTTLSDLQSSISYLKKRVGNCASASQVDSIKNDAYIMANTLLGDWRQAEERWESKLETMSQRLDHLTSLADEFRRLVDNKTQTLSTDVEKLAAKQRKIVDSTNTCIADIRNLRRDMKDLKHKQLRAERDPRTDNEQQPAANNKDKKEEDKMEENKDEEDKDEALYWKTIVQNAFALPLDTDWTKVRVANERQPVIFNRVSHRKWYIDEDKMDFIGRKRIIRAEHVPEFLRRLKEDCPVVLIGKKGRRYRMK